MMLMLVIGILIGGIIGVVGALCLLAWIAEEDIKKGDKK